MENNKIITVIWAFISIFAMISLVVFVHEAVHVVRVDSPQMMCLGFGDGYYGIVEHNTSFTEQERYIEEFYAQSISIIILLIYMFCTYHIVLKK